MGDFLTDPDSKQRSRYLFLFRHRFFQCRRIGHNIQRTGTRIHHFADGSRPLDTQGRFVIAPFDGAATVRQEENAVTFHQIVKVGTAILGRFPVGKDDQMDSFFRDMGEDKPTGRQK